MFGDRRLVKKTCKGRQLQRFPLDLRWCMCHDKYCKYVSINQHIWSMSICACQRYWSQLCHPCPTLWEVRCLWALRTGAGPLVSSSGRRSVTCLTRSISTRVAIFVPCQLSHYYDPMSMAPQPLSEGSTVAWDRASSIAGTHEDGLSLFHVRSYQLSGAHLFLDWPLSQPLWSGPSWMISSDIHSLKTQRSL